MLHSLYAYSPLSLYQFKWQKSDITNVRTYFATHFKNDVVAGLIVGALLVPQGMSYAILAKVPAQYGLYSATFNILAYALLGSSTQLAVGPVATASLLTGNAIAGYENRVQMALVLALLVGLLQISLALVRGGAIATWFSRPMLTGYTVGNALVIAISQLPNFFGIKISATQFPIYNLGLVLASLPKTKPYAVTFGLTALITLYGFRYIKDKLKSSWLRLVCDLSTVVVFAVSTAVSYALYLGEANIDLPIVGNLPKGFQSPSVPNIPLAIYENPSIIPNAFVIAVVVFFESWSVARQISKHLSNTKLNANRELLAVGTANFVGSFFNAFPVSGGLSRTSVNVSAGAASQVSTMVSVIVVVFALTLLTNALKWIPLSILSAIILIALLGMLKFSEIREAWRVSKREFIVTMVTLSASVGFGPVWGIVAGLVTSLASALFIIAVPHVAELGEIREGLLRNIKRYPNEAKRVNGYLVVRVDAPMFFANTEPLISKFTLMLTSRLESGEKIKAFVVDASGIGAMDLTALHALIKFQSKLKQMKIKLVLAEVRGPVRDVMDRFNIDKAHARITPFYEEALQGLGSDDSHLSLTQTFQQSQVLDSFSVHSIEFALKLLRSGEAAGDEENLIQGRKPEVDVGQASVDDVEAADEAAAREAVSKRFDDDEFMLEDSRPYQS